MRIETSTIKDIAYALDIPLISINTLKAVAETLGKTIPLEYWFCSMIDARRMEVYCAVYNQYLEEFLPTQAKIIEAKAFEKELKTNKIVFFGNGASKSWKHLQYSENAFLIENFTASAKGMGVLALKNGKLRLLKM